MEENRERDDISPYALNNIKLKFPASSFVTGFCRLLLNDVTKFLATIRRLAEVQVFGHFRVTVTNDDLSISSGI